MNEETQTLARDVLTNFVESGWSQWFMNLDYTRLPEDQDLFITEVKFEEFDESTMEPIEPRRVFHIKEEDVIGAMMKISYGLTNINEELSGRISEAMREQNYCNLDAETDDCIIQVAAFGEVVYG